MLIMIKKITTFLLLFILVQINLDLNDDQSLIKAASPSTIQSPIIKWQYGGCYSSWCETGWYSSPAVIDLEGDGSLEVIGSAYSIFVLDGDTGTLKWQVSSGHDRNQLEATNVGRTWSGVVVADLEGDGDLEIVTAHSGGYLSVYNHLGYFKSGWPQNPTSRELRGLSVYDLDGDGSMEIIATGAVSDKVNTWVFEPDGTLRDGWPQLENDSGYAWGVFNDNAAIGNLDSDTEGELIIPSDVHYICAYQPDGTQIPANSNYGDKAWGKVGVWESLDTELRGWGTCSPEDNRSERYRPNFAHSAAAIGDVNGDGINEVVATGNVYDCISGYPSKYIGLYIFNQDRSRFNLDGYDWNTPPIDTGAPLSEDYNQIENVQPNPVLADLDGDGNLEILYPSYDGRMHAFWLDKSEHGNWPYSVYQPSVGVYQFASEPVVADLDNDGFAEIIFSSWTQKGSGQTGKLYILDYLGNVIQQVDLPAAFGSADWNGALPAPTLANLDGDPDLEVVINTAHSGLVAYDLPDTANARILWGTGRGNYQRTGSFLQGNLTASSKQVDRVLANSGENLTYTIVLRNPGPILPNVTMRDTIPNSTQYLGDLWASSGSYHLSGEEITWNGVVKSSVPVTITFKVTIEGQMDTPQLITNIAEIEDGLDKIYLRKATTVTNGYALFIPLNFSENSLY
jgi:uncharacterized repeat protein (TIGR01451 family)